MKLGGEHLFSHHLFRLKYTELNEIYTVMAFRSFVVSLIGIFVPIYLWNLHYSLAEILFFELLIYLGEGLLEIPMAHLNARFGPKHLIAASMPVMVVHFLLLWTIPNYHWNIFFVAFTASLATALFWQAYHWDFSRSKHALKASSEVASIVILSSMAGATAPFLGGFISDQFGIGYVFMLVSFLLVFSIIPLFKTKELHVPQRIDFNRLKLAKIRNDLISYAGLASQGIVGMVIWPIFVYLIVRTYQNVGLATSGALLLSLFFTYILGKKADQGKRRAYLKTGSLLMSLVYFIKVIATTIFHVFSLDFFSNLANSFFYAPFVSEYYLHADEESRSEYIIVMEMTCDFTRALILIILLFFTLYYPDKTILIIGLLIAGLGSLLIGFMPQAKSEKLTINNTNIKIMPQPKN